MDRTSNSGAPARKLSLLPADTVGECARKALAFGAETLSGNHAAARAGDIEGLHRLRVATRRIRASIEMFSEALYAPQLKVFRRDLPWASAQAGAARECDVIAALIETRAVKIGPALGKAVTPMLDALAVRRAAAHREFCELLESKKYRNLIAKLLQPSIRKLSTVRRLGATAAPAAGQIARAAARMAAKLDQDAPASVFHKLRVRIKRLRYALELVADLGGKRHRKTLSRLEDLQETLGLCNDADVAIAWLRSYAASSGAAPDTILAAGALIQSLGSRERKLRRRSIRKWRRLERSDLIGGALAEIRKSGKAALAAGAAVEASESAKAAQPNATPDNAADRSQSTPVESNGHSVAEFTL
ncbi:MAG TPA: CHAD domain-containing protein [Candidatus Binataceae bacterium]|nr:CHAD domain-containing protein [Candidatus Binataceae bacterium]